jgi:hypothetical protein
LEIGRDILRIQILLLCDTIGANGHERLFRADAPARGRG